MPPVLPNRPHAPAHLRLGVLVGPLLLLLTGSEPAHARSDPLPPTGERESVQVLEQNHPNPFNPSTTIEIRLPHAGKIDLSIYNLRGRRVATLFRGPAPRGRSRFVWKGTDSKDQPVPSGIYFYRLIFGDRVLTRKMTLMQ